MSGDNQFVSDKRMRLIQAGYWLRNQREHRHISVREMASRLDVTTQMVYDWQNGKNAVSDERAEQIANLLRMDVIEVRRGLGLWIPPSADPNGEQRTVDIRDLPDDELAEEVTRRLIERTRQEAQQLPKTDQSADDEDEEAL